MGIVMLQVFSNVLHQKLAALPVDSSIRQQIEEQRSKLAEIEIPATAPSEAQPALTKTIDEAFLAGFRRVMFIGTALAWVSALFALLLIGGRRTHD
jgi:hypothetical protein